MVEIQTASATPRIVALASEIAERVVAPLAPRTDAEARWPEEAMRALGEASCYVVLLEQTF